MLTVWLGILALSRSRFWDQLAAYRFILKSSRFLPSLTGLVLAWGGEECRATAEMTPKIVSCVAEFSSRSNIEWHGSHNEPFVQSVFSHFVYSDAKMWPKCMLHPKNAIFMPNVAVSMTPGKIIGFVLLLVLMCQKFSIVSTDCSAEVMLNSWPVRWALHHHIGSSRLWITSLAHRSPLTTGANAHLSPHLDVSVHM